LYEETTWKKIGINGWTVLKWILNKIGRKGEDYINMAQARVTLPTPANIATVLNLQVPHKEVNFCQLCFQA
jgi:hypothetical protein